MTDPLVTVVVGGADPAGRDAVVAALGEHSRLAVVGNADANDVVAVAGDSVPDVVVLLDEPGATDAAATIGWMHPATRFLLVVDGPCTVTPAQVLDAGFGGVVDIGSSRDVAEAVDGLAHGEGFADADIASEVLDRRRRGESQRLSPTEEAVLERIAAGESVDAIGEDFVVAARLVRLHAGGAMARLGPGLAVTGADRDAGQAAGPS